MFDQVDQQLIEIIAKKKKLDPARITLDTTFAEIGIDSLDAIELAFTFEDTFHITMPDDAVQRIRTVRDAIDAMHEVLTNRTVQAN